MDFGLENDFESDDSFFDDPKLSKKPKTVEKKSLEDIFGFDDDKKRSDNVQVQKVRFNIEDTEKPEPTKAKTTLDWLASADEPDFLKKKETTTSKSDLLDDLLPQRSRKGDQIKTTSFEDILKDSKVPSSLEQLEKNTPSSLGSQRNQSEGLSMILEPPQGPRRGRRGSSAGVTDVLGLFGSGPPSSEFLGGDRKPSVEKAKNISTEVPEWLGVGSDTKHEAQIREPEERPPKKLEPEVSSGPAIVDVVEKPEPFQTNMSNLQTQESFLLVSLQLKKYEENLSEIKNQQQEILRKQESQFDLFLNKYIEKQKGIEQEMLSQQERINQHIRIMALKGFEGDMKTSKEEDQHEDDKIVQSLKQRHNEEFFLMEESYKKQISLLEKSSEQIEQRLNQEIENTSKTYEEKLENLKTQHREELKYWTEKMNDFDDKRRKEIDDVKDNHQRIMREVKDEFLDQLERFKEQRNRENDLLANGGDLTQKLAFSVEKLGKNEEILGQIQEKVVGDYNVLSVAREVSLEKKEKEITAMRATLEICRGQAEKDRSQLLALIRTLEQKISDQNHNSQEERWALQQAAATLAARSTAFDREVDFSRASIERERDQLKTLKEALLAEQEKITLQLTEEKLKVSAEKSRLEVSAKLVNNYEVEKIKTEAETAIQVAKELTEKLTIERSFVQRQKLELESVRSKLMEKERHIIEREENLEETKRVMQQNTNQDRILIQEAKHLENRYKEKLLELQSQAISLSSREKKLAEEKLSVSKERLTLYTSTKSHKKCMLCQAEDAKCDPELIRLRFEALDDERNSEVSREDLYSNK